MACGAPVICTEVGSLPEVVTDGVTGFVVPPNDSGALARRIASLLDNPEAVREMGARGRASVVERFTWEKVVDRCLHAYAQAHGGAGG
jgi:glycosyltransferase involved in cell wall biosynthesis